uniref:Uncharacterized protein n=1 Tax=Oryzias sinensis TaxID=183150 RepID=A0A8C8DVV7_9TELE
ILKDFSQISQEKGLSPVCVLMCTVRLWPWLKLFPHNSQEKGFSPVCVLMWMVNLEDALNPFPHISQEKGFSPFWLPGPGSHLVLVWSPCFPDHPQGSLKPPPPSSLQTPPLPH